MNLTEPLVDGETVKVTAKDAGGESAAITAQAPDLYAPAEPTAVVNQTTGAEVTGQTEPNAIVTVYGGSQGTTPLGSAVADSNGNYVVSLNPALVNGEEVKVTAKDPGGESLATKANAPDITPPDAPTAAFNATGSEVSGTAQPGSTVKVKDSSGNEIGTAVADASGNYKVTLNPALNDGQNVQVTASDAGGESAAKDLTAPNIPVFAENNVDQAEVEFEYPVTTKVLDNAISYSWLLGAFGVVIGQDSGSTQFAIANGKTADIELQIKSGSWGAFLDQVGITLSKYNDVTKQWDVIANNSSTGFLDFIGIFGEVAKVQVKDLQPGQYKVDMVSWNAVALPGFVETDIVIKEYDPSTQPVATTLSPATGNVLTDTDTTYGKDNIVAGAVVKSVDGVTVSGSTTITGDYGSLVIKADGSYTYTPNKVLSVIGKTEVFTYTVVDPVTGKTDTADLIIQIGTKSGLDLSWNAADPYQNATTNLVANDDVNTAQINVQQASTTQTAVTGAMTSSVTTNGTRIGGTSTLAVTKLAADTVAKLAIKVTLPSSGTDTANDTFKYQVQYKDASGNWVNATGSNASGTVTGPTSYQSSGATLINTSYTAQSSVSTEWRVQFTSTESASTPWFGTTSTNVNTSVQATVTNLNVSATGGVTKAIGNIITDDTGFGVDHLANENAKLWIKNPTTGAYEIAKGDVITVSAGKLVLQQSGEYEFTPNATSGSGSVTFDYKLVAANGVEETAKLTIDFGQAFVSTGSNDQFALGTAADKVIFNVLANDALGGNGQDTWTDFNKAEKDSVDISKLLEGQTVTEANIADYVSVTQKGSDVVISIDRDGKGAAYSSKVDLITLKNTDVTLQDLLDNNHLLY